MAEIIGDLVYFDDGTVMHRNQFEAWKAKNTPAPVTDVVAPPPVEQQGKPSNAYRFGDVGRSTGNETLGTAWDLAMRAGHNTTNPIARVGDYIASMAGAGLLGGIGGLEKAVGYGADLLPMSPESKSKFARDTLGMLDVAGVNPESRSIELMRSLGAKYGLLNMKGY